MKKVVRVFFVVTFVVFSTISLLHSPVNAETIQLTDNDYGDYDPQINNAGNVVWYGHEGVNDWKVFIYDGTTTTQLTDNNYMDWNPQINDAGNIVW